MPTIKTDIEQIKTLAWTLAVASGRKLLDVPGEYIWATPTSQQFDYIRGRHRSIFSSGNAIKDKDITAFVQALPVTKFYLDPYIVKKAEEQFPSWVAQSPNYKLQNFDLFKYTGFSAGTQETFINFYLVNRNKRFRIFRGDYWWHMDLWENLGLDWKYLDEDDIKDYDVCIISNPFAVDGEKHPKLDWLIDECNRKGVELLVDFIYLPNSRNVVDIDLSADCIKQITFSYSKTFPVQCAKVAFRMCKKKPSDPMQISNDENICNRLSAGLALSIMNHFPIDYMVKKYQYEQEHWCTKLGLKKSNVVHFGTGDAYQAPQGFISKYNIQHNRYNLGILYENKDLLIKLGLY